MTLSPPSESRRRFPRPSGCPLVVRYLGAMMLVGVALAIRMAIAPPNAGLPFITFFPTTALAAILFGFGPGLVAAAVSSVLAGLLFLPPVEPGTFTLWSQLVFLGDALLVCWAVNAMHRYQARYDQALQQALAANHALEGEIEVRREAEAALARAGSALAASNAELRQFAHSASHDLQEPLRMVTSYLSLLERRYGELFDDQGRDFLHFATDGAKRMSGLIRDLLDYARLDRQAIEPAPVETVSVVDEAKANLGPAIAESAARIEVIGDLPVVAGDRGQLVRLFQNLLGNAIKYRHPDRAPRVRIEALRQGDEWRFAVTDNGIGIAPEHFERIFQVFQRLHAVGEYDGSGIGLAIVKRVVEGHGGRVWVESQPDRGASFLFTLPAVAG